MQVRIRQAQPSDRDQLAQLREALWTKTSAAEHARELEATMAGDTPGAMPLINFVSESADGTLTGFADVDLSSHADRCDPICPVGYLEGWYVTKEYRRYGLGRRLLAAAEDWARVVTAVSRWRPTHGSTTNFRKTVTKHWVLKLLTDACIIVRGYRGGSSSISPQNRDTGESLGLKFKPNSARK
jgi:GNAT superfamily N-acetyltransferase